MMASSPTQGQGVEGEQGVYVASESGAVDEGHGADARRVGQGQPQSDRSAGGVSDDVEWRSDAQCVEELGNEGGHVAAGSVGADREVALAMTGKAQRQYPVGAGRGLGMTHRQLVALCSWPCSSSNGRPAAGLEVLGGCPGYIDSTVVQHEVFVLLDRLDRGGRRKDRHKASWCARFPDSWCVARGWGNTETS